ncbi:M13 family metallopeptidase [Sphingobium nicotianae]|uniref:M13 family metallopeptidase n=1 Tax=Sphingobium nicotianae TaxID=2782607 RepID=A0A9X1DG37_9SPHN|nr:M13 family metallopeptidase [Sphingobium nicotianae]MBT2189246.1 M13 family metallopeptidase [Sphingobium nicotianae]
MRSIPLLASTFALALSLPVAAPAGTVAANAVAGGTLAKPVMPRYGSWGVDLSARDTRVSPGDDFDDFVNGSWRNRTVIPVDKTSMDGFTDIYDLTLEQKKYVIASQGAQTQIGGLYKSFMDEPAVEKAGDTALRRTLAQIRAIPDKTAFARHMGATAGGFGRAIIDGEVGPDPADPNTNILWLGQGGLGLPDRDYYLKDDFKPKRDAYLAYMTRQLGLAGYPAPARAAAEILAFETEIARLSWVQADRREIEKINNPMTLASLQAYAPGLDWAAYLGGMGVAQPGKLLVAEKSAIQAIAALYARTPLETLKAWEAFGVLAQASPYLPKRYVDSRFQFNKAMYGQEELAPRWKRADTLLDNSLGELMGQIYVADFFPDRSKAMMEELVANLKVAMAKRIAGNDWMAPDTKMAALEKLARMEVMVGHPRTFRDFTALKIDANDLYGNVERSSAFEWQYQLSQLYKPVDREKWGLNPQTVNAYNGGLENKIVFPAGILQAPAFDPDADAAVNYGAIGAIIGHEISHGFDDQGRKIDANGAVRDWWTAADAARFQAQADAFGKQYDGYEPVPGMHVNGKLTMGENIADLAGVLIAYDAYHASLKGKPAPVIDGLTGDQRFFLAYAQFWRAKQRPDAAKAQMASDPHTPSQFRIIGPLRNVDAWYDAFDVKPETKYALKADERVRIW